MSDILTTKHPYQRDREFGLGVLLAKRNQHHDALDRLKPLINENKKYLTYILIPLYKHLTTHYNNFGLRMLIIDLYMSAGWFHQAIEELEEAYKLDPHYTQTYYYLGKLYKDNIEKPLIKSIFEDAFNQGILDSSITDLLPKMYEEEHATDKNISLFKTLIQNYPDHSQYYNSLYELYLENNHTSQAATLLTTISEKFPRQIATTAEKCERILIKNPENTNLLNTFISLNKKACKPDKIIPAINQLTTLKPDTIPTMIHILKECLQTFPNNPELIKCLATQLIELSHYSEAITHLKELAQDHTKEHDDIITLTKKVLERYPEQFFALQLLFEIMLERKDITKCLHHTQTMMTIQNHDCSTVENCLKQVIQNTGEHKNEAQLQLAQLFLINQNFSKCTKICNTLIQTHKEVPARLILSKIATIRQKFSESRHQLQEVLRLEPYHKKAHENLKQLHLKVLTDEIEKRTNSPQEKTDQNHFEIGLLHLRNNNFKQALQTFQALTHNDDIRLPSRLLSSRCFMEEGRFDQASTHLKELLNDIPKTNQKLANKVRFLLATNDFLFGSIESGLNQLNTIQQYDINFPKAGPLIKEYKEHSLLDLRGKTVSATNHHMGGAPITLTIENLEENDHVPHQEDSKSSFAHHHNNDGVSHLLKQHYKAAEESFNLALQMDPNLTAIYCNLAILEWLQSNYNKAQNYLQIAGTLNPKSDIIPLNLGLIHQSNQQLDDAENMFQKAIRLNPNNALAKLNLGDIYYAKNNIKKAFKYWLEAGKKHTLYFLILRRIHYLRNESFSFNHWISDFELDLNTFIPSSENEEQQTLFTTNIEPTPTLQTTDTPLPFNWNDSTQHP